MSVIAIASAVAAVLLALSRVINTSKPLWLYLPVWLRRWLPVLAFVLPSLAEKAADSTTPTDLLNLGVLAAALIVPGVLRDKDGDGLPDDEEES